MSLVQSLSSSVDQNHDSCQSTALMRHFNTQQPPGKNKPLCIKSVDLNITIEDAFLKKINIPGDSDNYSIKCMTNTQRSKSFRDNDMFVINLKKNIHISLQNQRNYISHEENTNIKCIPTPLELHLARDHFEMISGCLWVCCSSPIVGEKNDCTCWAKHLFLSKQIQFVPSLRC